MASLVVCQSLPEDILTKINAIIIFGVAPPPPLSLSLVVLLYDRTSVKTVINDACKQLFVKKGRQFDTIPPTRAALLEHSKRPVLQAGYIWGQALTLKPYTAKSTRLGLDLRWWFVEAFLDHTTRCDGFLPITCSLRLQKGLPKGFLTLYCPLKVSR